MARKYQMCTQCLMDTTDPDIIFDEKGVCNHCKNNEKWLKLQAPLDVRLKELEQIAERIKREGKGKEYDCIMGLSGGTDSSFVAYKAKELGLRPLAVHFDNGWNSEIAVKNVENIVRKLGLGYFTHVINWDEFRDMQVAFFKASVVDIELLTDNAILAVMFQTARKYKIKYILSGGNRATEFYPLPKTWRWNKFDTKNIRSIHKQFGSRKIKTFPYSGLWDRLTKASPWGLKFVKVLNYIDYNKTEAKEILKKEVGWKEYGGKHHESIFTKFYQSYFLPNKFDIDKRKTHLSSLIWSGQITREEALKELAKPFYKGLELEQELEYVCKKLGFSLEEFEAIMKMPPKSHLDYPSHEGLYNFVDKVFNVLRVILKRFRKSKVTL